MGDSTLRGFGARGGRRWTFWFGVGLVFEVLVVPTPHIRAPYIRGGWYSGSCLLPYYAAKLGLMDSLGCW